MRILSDVEMTVTAELGRAFMTVRELLSLTPGSIVELDRVAGTPIDVLVNGTVVARGEVVVVDEEFGVRITEIVDDSNV
jgi:flagellar motor switch protein FliN/FliY